MTDREKELVKQYREENKSYKEIADIIGTTKNIVKSHCNNYGLNGFRAKSYDIEKQERIFKEHFEERHEGFVYLSGYTPESAITQAGRMIKCQCKKCGHIQERHARSGNAQAEGAKMRCDNCTAEMKAAQLLNKKITRKEIKYKEVQCKHCGIVFKAQRSNTPYCSDECKSLSRVKAKVHKVCKECGEPFETSNSRQSYCSDECNKKHANRTRDVNRRHKLRENGKIDWDISLNKLIERDGAVCHICGEKVDMTVDSNDDYYGSIDHVNPVSKGGTHTWDNVKLAHRKCNSAKSNKIIYEGAGGQVVMSI